VYRLDLRDYTGGKKRARRLLHNTLFAAQKLGGRGCVAFEPPASVSSCVFRVLFSIGRIFQLEFSGAGVLDYASGACVRESKLIFGYRSAPPPE